jgi:hypothetical protein
MIKENFTGLDILLLTKLKYFGDFLMYLLL